MIGRALAAACPDPAVLARIGGPLGQAARAAQRELARVPDDARRARRAAWAADARAPVPAGLRGADASWIEAGLAELPPRARTAVGSVGGGSEVDVWLARWACAVIPPLPAIDRALPRPRSIDDAIGLSAAALREWLEDLGAAQLAFAIGDPAAIVAAARVVGDRLTHAAARLASAPAELTTQGPRRAAIERSRVELDDRALIRIGARAIAAHVSGLTRRQLVVRLPRTVGQVVAREICTHASTPPDHAPAL